MLEHSYKLVFARICKVKEDAHEVWAIATEEVVDCDNEIMDYESSKPEFEEWSNRAKEATDGKSLGAVRLMHQLKAIGKLISITFDDANKRISVVAKILDEDAWQLIKEGVLTGLSIGGKVVRKWADAVLKGVTRFCVRPIEVSCVDVPCLPTAIFQVIKADGSVESRHFKTEVGNVIDTEERTDFAAKLDAIWSELQGLKKAKDGDGPKTKRVAGEDLPASAFAFAGDPNRTETWKLPLHFSSEEKSKRHVKNALARESQTQGIPESEKAKVHAKIVAAAKKYGIEVSEEGKKSQQAAEFFKSEFSVAASKAGLAKSMQNITDLAQMLQQMRWVLLDAEWEADYEFGGEGDPRDEVIAVEMRALIEHCIEILKDVVEDETSEIAATAKKAAEGVLTMKLEEISKAANSLHDHFKKAAAHHEKLASLHKAKHEHHLAKAAEHETAGNAGLEEMKAVHKSMAAGHKFDAEHHANMHKAHVEHATHCAAMADKCMGKADEVDTAKIAAEEAAKAAGIAKAAGASSDFAQLFTDMTKSITDSIGALKTDIDVLKSASVEIPKGVHLVPRPAGEVATAAAASGSRSYNSTGF